MERTMLSCGALHTRTCPVADRRAQRRRPLAARAARSALTTGGSAPTERGRGRVVVSGGGLAGMLTTLALRNIGFDAICYDRGGSDTGHVPTSHR